jgi:hypothetical protein
MAAKLAKIQGILSSLTPKLAKIWSTEYFSKLDSHNIESSYPDTNSSSLKSPPCNYVRCYLYVCNQPMCTEAVLKIYMFYSEDN